MTKELSDFYSDSKKSNAKVFLDEISGQKAYNVKCIADGREIHSAIFLSEVEAEDYAEDWVQLHG